MGTTIAKEAGLFRIAGLVLLGILVLQVVLYVRQFRQLPVSDAEKGAVVSPVQKSEMDVAPEAGAWNVLQPGEPAARVESRPAGSLADRLRLAGTFFLFGAEEGDRGARRAIIDDLPAGTQHLLSEGDIFEDMTLTTIDRERVVMSRNGVDTELFLSFAPPGNVANPTAGSGRTGTAPVDEPPALETSRFGKRIGDNRWILRKDALMEYYYELLDDPERIANVYMSMEPDYREEGNVGGYRVAQKGEQDFFQSVGLQEGDTIRRVNSMNMTSQSRAEYFISEFVKDRISALVLDIERDGEPQKLIYMMR